MMPDLGSYAVEVLAAYAVTFVLLAWVVSASVSRARRVRRELDQAEGKLRADG